MKLFGILRPILGFVPLICIQNEMFFSFCVSTWVIFYKFLAIFGLPGWILDQFWAKSDKFVSILMNYRINIGEILKNFGKF